MDSIVSMGNRVPHLSPEYYLPLAKRDSAEALRARLPNHVCHYTYSVHCVGIR